ncbi:hypothetical protein Trydic_g13905 [Trypoxylus dichotomus]
MSAAGTGNIECIGGIMDNRKYVNTLYANLIQGVKKLGLGGGWIFQQDNDPKHTSYLAMELILYNVPHQLHSPPQSPYLNRSEYLWVELKLRLSQRVISGHDSLKRTILEKGAQISKEVTQKYIQYRVG